MSQNDYFPDKVDNSRHLLQEWQADLHVNHLVINKKIIVTKPLLSKRWWVVWCGSLSHTLVDLSNLYQINEECHEQWEEEQLFEI